MITVELKRYGAKKELIEVASLSEASQVVRSFITKYNLGSSTWEGGKVRINRVLTNEISYNGSIWTWHKDWKKRIEVK